MCVAVLRGSCEDGVSRKAICWVTCEILWYHFWSRMSKHVKNELEGCKSQYSLYFQPCWRLWGWQCWSVGWSTTLVWSYYNNYYYIVPRCRLLMTSMIPWTFLQCHYETEFVFFTLQAAGSAAQEVIAQSISPAIILWGYATLKCERNSWVNRNAAMKEHPNKQIASASIVAGDRNPTEYLMYSVKCLKGKQWYAAFH